MSRLFFSLLKTKSTIRTSVALHLDRYAMQNLYSIDHIQYLERK